MLGTPSPTPRPVPAVSALLVRELVAVPLSPTGQPIVPPQLPSETQEEDTNTSPLAPNYLWAAGGVVGMLLCLTARRRATSKRNNVCLKMLVQGGAAFEHEL